MFSINILVYIIDILSSLFIYILILQHNLYDLQDLATVVDPPTVFSLAIDPLTLDPPIADMVYLMFFSFIYIILFI